MQLDIPEPLRRAVNAMAALRGVSPSDIVVAILREHLPADEVRRAEQAVEAEESGESPAMRSKRGRKPKS
jgi:hypothetical protein